MSPTRLAFLYPYFIRPLILAEVPVPSLATRVTLDHGQSPAWCCPGVSRPRNARLISTAKRLRRSSRRHGKAVEPDQNSGKNEEQTKVNSSGDDGQSQKTQLEETAEDIEIEKTVRAALDRAEREMEKKKEKSMKKALENGPMDSILKAGSGSDDKSKPKQQKKPALVPPPYIHTFDTYDVVRQLQQGGFTESQSIEAMKAVRFLLAVNITTAKDVLVSKSDVDNETYLFRAACSELSTEVKNNRKAANEAMRQQRTTLQHEMDILTQSLNQELATLDDTVKNMFNERKMAVKEEQNRIDSYIQQLHLKISAKLNSDAKSDIEGVRWIIMRIVAGGLVFAAILALGMFKYVSETKKARREAEKRKRKEEEERKQRIGREDFSPAPAAIEILAAN